MPKTKTEMILLENIVNKFDVRKSLSEDRIMYFVNLYENGVDVPPIEVVSIQESIQFAYVEGRHRGAARAYLNYKDIEAIVLPASLGTDPVGCFLRALEANFGGAMPSSREEIAHTITRLLEMGATQKELKERIKFLPPRAVDLYIQWGKGVLNKRKITGALDAVADGLTIEKASEMFKVKPDRIKDAIQGKKRKYGRVNVDQQVATELKGYISKVLHGANGGIAKKLDGLLKQVENGEVSSKTATGIVQAWHEHLRRTNIRINDWLARIDSISAIRDKMITKEEEKGKE